jgi:hypothetical protein
LVVKVDENPFLRDWHEEYSVIEVYSDDAKFRFVDYQQT